MGTRTFTYTFTGTESIPGTFLTGAIPNWTGVFTANFGLSGPAGTTVNLNWGFTRTSSPATCWGSSVSFVSSDTAKTQNLTVGVPGGSWACSDWDTFYIGYGGATLRLGTGSTITITFDGAGIPGTNYAAVAYKLTVGSSAAGTDTRYQLLSGKDQANGYAGLDSGTRVPTARLGSGTASSSTFLRGDQTWAAGAGGSSPLTTKGDIYVYGSSDTRLPVGSDTQVLTADSSQSSGLRWAAATGGGGGALTKYDEQILASAQQTVTFSSIPGTYRTIRVAYQARRDASGAVGVNMRLNGDTGANYDWERLNGDGTIVTGDRGTAQTFFPVGSIPGTDSAAGVSAQSACEIVNYAGTTFHKTFVAQGMLKSGTNVSVYVRGGAWRNTAAVTSVSIICETNNFVAGSAFTLYLES